jgi:REP element-mobilizing transposase RayT
MPEKKPARKTNRLKEFDYSADGYYFITVCVRNHQDYFGEIVGGRVVLNELGRIVEGCWTDLLCHYSTCILDEFIIMPNHMHGIIVIDNKVGNGLKPFPTKCGLSEIVRGFKTFSSREINKRFEGVCFRWQKSFYDHIIRDEDSLFHIREYIRNNTLKWELGVGHGENLDEAGF